MAKAKAAEKETVSSNGVVKVKFVNGIEAKVPIDSTLAELAKEYCQDEENAFPILGAMVNNKLYGLDHQLKSDSFVEFVNYKDSAGKRIYQRSICAILVRAIQELRHNTRLVIGPSIGNSIYYDYYTDGMVDDKTLNIIKSKMNEIIARDDKFVRTKLSVKDATELFVSKGYMDKAKLLGQYKKTDMITVYSCGNYIDLSYGPLVPSTAYAKVYDLKLYHNGFLICFPSTANPRKVSSIEGRRKLFGAYHNTKKLGRALGINTVWRLNEAIEDRKISEHIKIAESYHEKMLSKIADEINERKTETKIVLIAGPSSSGKTTFSKRLSIHLKAVGIKPVALSLDNYFVNREDNPLDENGRYDFESIYSLDLELFNRHLVDLLKGKEIEVPKFNFEKGKRDGITEVMQIDTNQIIIIEGIHGLNEELTRDVPSKNKYKIYVSPLTQLCIDEFNRIPTTDTRIIRRMVRDYQFRGYSALDTIRRWPSVRNGEEKYIFPFQEEADFMFNTALVYELAVLKPHAEKLLKEIPRELKEYNEALRLLRFLQFFRELDASEVPPTSILREFIGGSSIKY